MISKITWKDPSDHGSLHELFAMAYDSRLNCFSFVSLTTGEEKSLFVSDLRLSPPLPGIGDYHRETIEKICWEQIRGNEDI